MQLQISPAEIARQVNAVIARTPAFENQLKATVSAGGDGVTKCYLTELVPTRQSVGSEGVTKLVPMEWIVCPVFSQDIDSIHKTISACRKEFLAQNPYEYLVKEALNARELRKAYLADKMQYQMRDFQRFLENRESHRRPAMKRPRKMNTKRIKVD